MDIPKMILALGILFGATQGIQIFSRHTRRAFGYGFFTMRGFGLAAIGINLLWWGHYFWLTNSLRHIPTSGGLMLMLLGVAALIWLVYENIRCTNLPYGLGGSTLQIVFFFPIALYGIPILVVAILFMAFAAYKGAPAWLIDLDK